MLADRVGKSQIKFGLAQLQNQNVEQPRMTIKSSVLKFSSQQIVGETTTAETEKSADFARLLDQPLAVRPPPLPEAPLPEDERIKALVEDVKRKLKAEEALTEEERQRLADKRHKTQTQEIKRILDAARAKDAKLKLEDEQVKALALAEQRNLDTAQTTTETEEGKSRISFNVQGVLLTFSGHKKDVIRDAIKFINKLPATITLNNGLTKSQARQMLEGL